MRAVDRQTGPSRPRCNASGCDVDLSGCYRDGILKRARRLTFLLLSLQAWRHLLRG